MVCTQHQNERERGAGLGMPNCPLDSRKITRQNYDPIRARSLQRFKIARVWNVLDSEPTWTQRHFGISSVIFISDVRLSGAEEIIRVTMTFVQVLCQFPNIIHILYARAF